MPRTLFAVLPTLALMAVLSPGQVIAGPPEGVSGRMVLDEVAEWLVRYRKAQQEDMRIALLESVGERRNDPRIKVTLGEALSDPSPSMQYAAARQLMSACGVKYRPLIMTEDMKDYWQKNEADLRRRAKQLPR